MELLMIVLYGASFFLFIEIIFGELMLNKFENNYQRQRNKISDLDMKIRWFANQGESVK